MERNLNTAQMILLLISANFFASENCDKAMMYSLLMQKKEHVYVIPVILRPVDWKALPIGTLRVLPAKGKSLSKYLASDCRRHECPVLDLADVLNTNLQTGSCLVLLDGLDEVVNADDHRKVVQQLEDFVRCYEDFPNRFIITSRHTG